MKRKDLSLIAGIALCTLTVLLTVIYVMSPAPPEETLYIPPCDTDSDTADAIRAVTENGYMTLFNVDGSAYFYPEQTVKRGELAVILTNLIPLSADHSAESALGIADEGTIPPSQLPAVRAALREGYMKLYGDYTFRPAEPLTREEAADVLGSLCKISVSTGKSETIEDLDTISPHFRDNTKKMIELGIMQGANGLFRPKDAITRKELALVIYRITESEYFIQRKS